MEKPVTFESKGQQIVGMLHLPGGTTRVPAVLLLHGFTGHKGEIHQIFVKLARRLAAQGIACLRFDFRGSGDSEGNFEDMTVRSQVMDALEAMKFLAKQKRVNARRIGLVGFSLGAANAAHVVAKEGDRVKSLVLWSPVAEGGGILDGFSTPEAVAALAQTGTTDYGANLVGVEFIRQFADMKPVREAAKSKCPVLLVHGSEDETVPVEHAEMYERALQANKRLVKKVIIAGADHCFSRCVWEHRVLNETLDWIEETL